MRLESLFTGHSPFKTDDFTEAVARRFEKIRHTEAFQPKEGDYCYDGNRTQAENIGWRSAQTSGFEVPPAKVEAGFYDEAIAKGFHEAASAEHYYRYEKDWG